MTDAPLVQTRQTTSEYGILSGPRALRLDRVPASPDLATLVERHWLVSWDLPPGRRDPVTLLPHPCVNLVHDRGMVAVAGVGSERFTYLQEGAGRVFGVKFRPGGFHPFLRGPVSALTDQTVPLRWPGAAQLAAELTSAPDLPALVEVAERYLRANWPEEDLEVERVGKIVHALLYDRTITRVDEICARFDLAPRTLQRLFQRYVGVTPKWVLRRYRLHEAAARLAEGTTGTWAEVAVDLGYFDQPHFIRDFTRAVGMTPAAYAEACTRHEAPLST
ncbi:AraC family transcriptional regulator [Actinophytocola oryzae]|uniref:AraC family transcriptional regulator n=1 Tax=Actinophytocola oryzae TaxID=502181 RepID=A0A4R7VS33_9PSEU|nr:helix-turn-helix domain-containing protein [Actinophytocola oryzae]TDV52298.1 AraC family transcriptional regulator [Actinophytocola oryzae]